MHSRSWSGWACILLILLTGVDGPRADPGEVAQVTLRQVLEARSLLSLKQCEVELEAQNKKLEEKLALLEVELLRMKLLPSPAPATPSN